MSSRKRQSNQSPERPKTRILSGVDIPQNRLSQKGEYTKKDPLLRRQKKREAIEQKKRKLLHHKQNPKPPWTHNILEKITTPFMQNFREDFDQYNLKVGAEFGFYDQDLRRSILKAGSKYPHFDDLLRTSKASWESPRPPEPRLPTYQQLRDRETQIDQKFKSVKTRKWRTRLEKDKKDLVEETLKKPGEISELPGAYCQAHDIRKLQPGTWMNDEICTFYGVMINIRSTEHEKLKSDPTYDPKEKFLRAHCFSSFFMPKYQKEGFAGVRRWTKKVDLFKKDVVIFPINLRNVHWTCAAINLRQKRFEFYDSMGHNNEVVLECLKEYIQAEHLAKRNEPMDMTGWTFAETNPPRQNNAYDCGIFMCQIMDCLSRDWGGGDTVFDFSQENMPYMRTKMIYEVATCKFLEEEWK